MLVRIKLNEMTQINHLAQLWLVRHNHSNAALAIITNIAL